jgi:hypothetical protein
MTQLPGRKALFTGAGTQVPQQVSPEERQQVSEERQQVSPEESTDYRNYEKRIAELRDQLE